MKKTKEVLNTAAQASGKVNNILALIKNGWEVLTIVIVQLITAVVGFVTKNLVTSLICFAVCSAVATIIMTVLLIRERRGEVKGTFAVSAFIFYGKDNKLLLYKSKSKSTEEHGFYVQPSVFYKKKRWDENEDELLTPYRKIHNYLNKVLTLYMEHLKPISYLPLEYEHQWLEQTLSNFITRNKEVLFPQYGLSDVEKAMRKYRENEISLSPLLTIIEKNPDALKSSGEKFHIDFYYAFRLSENAGDLDAEIRNGKFKIVSRKELKDMLDEEQTHGDLLAIYDILRYLVTKVKEDPKVEISNCTFSCRKKTAYWRITECCNCNCNYCFIGREKQPGDVRVEEETIEKVIQIIENNDIEKLVISGGEPLLVSNLADVMERISEAGSNKLKISVCTNALSEFEDFQKISAIPQFEKFVVSIDGYDRATYGRYKRIKVNGSGKKTSPARLEKVIGFISKAQKSKINVAVNTIITKDLLDNTDNYIEFFNELGIEELSLSALISNNSKNRNIRNFIMETGQILNFYNMIVTDKIHKFNYLKKLDFIIPSCTYSSKECECLKKKKLFYISPEGNMTEGCMERASS